MTNDLWAKGGFTLRILADGARRDAIVSVTDPFAVIGRAPGAAVVFDDPAVSARHAYLHLDRRGLFAVDLATRTGTRVGPSGGPAGWLAPGDRVEVAGREVEVLALRLDQDEDAAGTDVFEIEPASPLDDTGNAPIARLTLFPESAPRDPLSLNSRLVFVGRSPACAVPVDSPTALRVQCVLVRDETGAYVVDLVGRGTWKNGRPLRGAEALADGDSLMVGSARYQCRVEPPGPLAYRPALSLGIGSTAPESMSTSTELANLVAAAPPMHLVPADAQAAVLGWLMNQLQSRQDEASRRQADLQVELVKLVAEIHRDNHAVLNRHLERSDALRRELAEVREELRRRFGPGTSPSHAGPASLNAPRLPPLKIVPAAPPEDPAAAASWLLSRVNQLEQENRKGWKDLLGRLVGNSGDDARG